MLPDLIKVAAFLIGFGIQWGVLSTKVQAIETEVNKASEDRKAVGEVRESIARLEAISKSDHELLRDIHRRILSGDLTSSGRRRQLDHSFQPQTSDQQ